MCSFDSALIMQSNGKHISEKDRIGQNYSKDMASKSTVIDLPSAFIILVSEKSKTKSGSSCHIPFIYNDMHYDSCINVDNGGVPWCYTNFTKKEWDTCNNSHSSPDSLDKNPSNLPAAFGLPATFRKINRLFENHQFPGIS